MKTENDLKKPKKRRLKMNIEYLAIDVETAADGHICEIGMARIVDGRITITCSQFVKPACYPDFDVKHQAVHGIQAHDLSGAPTFKELWETDMHLLIKPNVLLIAHNAIFDVRQITTEMKRNGIKLFPIRYFCTMQQSKKWLKGLDSYGLKNVCKFMRIGLQNHHRAEADATASARIFLKLPKNHKDAIKTI